MAATAKRRECPVHWVPLEPKTFNLRMKRDVVADQCPKCQGLFLDENEIGRITGNSKLNTLLTRYVGLDSDSQRVCPACGGVMDGEDAAGTRVDVCLTCFGVWLDAGELEALQAMSEKEFSSLSREKQTELFDAEQSRKRSRGGRGKFYQLLWSLGEALKPRRRL